MVLSVFTMLLRQEEKFIILYFVWELGGVALFRKHILLLYSIFIVDLYCLEPLLFIHSSLQSACD
uniref:Uncharacterized protein n=1 Tax=Nelumbo nucifera TaxID=4432 RepID=A0A822ZJ29_NELNU|nr:TPA_asm: hypothetical protein HUJ06_002874 [Nelumbo nucifera]